MTASGRTADSASLHAASSDREFCAFNFDLHHGGLLPCARMVYRTWGTLAADGSNLVLFPTWFSSTHEQNAWLIGPGKALDPSHYFVVSINLLGNGISSSPSNTPAPLDRRRFPRIAMLDNVRLAALLLKQEFGVGAPTLVMGRSMGAQFSFQWASWLPERTRRLFCLTGSARTTPHNWAFLEGVKAALMADTTWAKGEYTTPPVAGLEAVGVLYAGWAMSQAFYRQGLHLADADSVEAYVRANWRGNFLKRDANDLLSMIDTWQSFDPSDNARYRGDWKAAMRAIRSPTIVMPSRTDLYFPPEDSALAAAAIPNAQLRVIESVWGHRAGTAGSDVNDISCVESAIADLLRIPA